MRILEAKEEVKEEVKEEAKKEVSFNNLLVNELGKECYGINFFSSIGIHKKSCGLCDLAKFFWKIAEETSEIKMKIKKFLITAGEDFCYPQIDAVELNKESVFQQAFDYESDRIKHLYELIEKAPCDCTKSFVEKLIKRHSEILHLLDLANKISQISEDPLLIQKSVYKLIWHE